MSTPDRALVACGFHDAECAGYQADLPLWVALADTTGGPVVDLGAGTGRVTVPLAAAGHDVIAVDLDADLLDELDRRARDGGVAVRTISADACALADALPDALLGTARLIVMPMQTIQLLGGVQARRACLAGCAVVAAPGAELAISIVPEVEPFDGRDATPLLLPPDVAQLGGLRFASTALAVLQPSPDAPIQMHRRRAISDESGAPVGEPCDVVITLDPLTVAELQREAAAAGWVAGEVIELPETDEHAASIVVVFTRERGA
ncbi:MAG: methyltransferase domain-containing protein [Patulibacter sp.]